MAIRIPNLTLSLVHRQIRDAVNTGSGECQPNECYDREQLRIHPLPGQKAAHQPIVGLDIDERQLRVEASHFTLQTRRRCRGIDCHVDQHHVVRGPVVLQVREVDQRLGLR